MYCLKFSFDPSKNEIDYVKELLPKIQSGIWYNNYFIELEDHDALFLIHEINNREPIEADVSILKYNEI